MDERVKLWVTTLGCKVTALDPCLQPILASHHCISLTESTQLVADFANSKKLLPGSNYVTICRNISEFLVLNISGSGCTLNLKRWCDCFNVIITVNWWIITKWWHVIVNLTLFKDPSVTVVWGMLCSYKSKLWYVEYLKNGDNGPQQGIKVLPVWYCVSGLCLKTEFASKNVHPKDTAIQYTTQHTLGHLMYLTNN